MGFPPRMSKVPNQLGWTEALAANWGWSAFLQLWGIRNSCSWCSWPSAHSVHLPWTPRATHSLHRWDWLGRSQMVTPQRCIACFIVPSNKAEVSCYFCCLMVNTSKALFVVECFRSSIPVLRVFFDVCWLPHGLLEVIVCWRLCLSDNLWHWQQYYTMLFCTWLIFQHTFVLVDCCQSSFFKSSGKDSQRMLKTHELV